MATEAAPADSGLSDDTLLYHQLDAYPWSEDQEFQGGLHAILGSVQDAAQVEHLTLRAKCYYYARKAGTHVDFDGYKRWVENGQTHAPSTNGLVHTAEGGAGSAVGGLDEDYGEVVGEGDGGMRDAPKPASFAEICDMIAEGKPIPGIKDIPDTILEGQASASQTQWRKKPWETRPSGAETLSGAVSQEGRGQEKSSWMR